MSPLHLSFSKKTRHEGKTEKKMKMERDKKCNYTVTGNQVEMVKKKNYNVMI